MSSETHRIKDLIRTLNYYTDLYNQGFTTISDEEWDTMYFELAKLEESTGIIYPNSPTQTIRYESVSKLEKVTHSHPMLSLDKTKDPKEVESFVNQSSYKETSGWCAMFKLDGLTCSLTYEDGKLVKAETRGNGTVGEDVTHNALVIPSIPKEIPNKELTIIDGEIICKIDDFNLYFANNYKNPRNFASGSIRLLSATECASRKLTFIAWDLIKGCDDIDFFFWRLEKLDDWGFFTVPRVGDAETVHDAMNILDSMKEDEIYCNCPIDGYVFRFESQKYYNSLGATDHHFRGAIAYKFYDEDYETELIDIEWSMGRTGVLTPVAIYEDIDIDGSVCNRASLHNLSILEQTLGTPYRGQKIYVYKANQIIPQIRYGEQMTSFKGAGYIITEPKVCPICGKSVSLKIENGVKTLWCDNSTCEGKLSNRIDHFCGKKGLDIKGLSLKTIEKLIEWGWINELGDIFKLDRYKAEWVSKAGFGEASVGKILSAITSARTSTSLESFISAIGIPLVGRTIAKTIAKEFSTWQEFRDYIDTDDCFFDVFDGIGEEIDNSLKDFDYTEADEIAGMLTFVQSEVQNEVTPAAAIKDKVFCITGKVTHFKNRDELKAEIESLGGKVTSSVTSKTNYLINNDINSTSAKNKTAKANNIPIITEEEYLKMKS